MAYPKKPSNLKVITGSTQPDDGPVIDLPLVSDVPCAPDWMPNAHATKEWDRLAPILQKVGLLTEAGTSTLAHLCALHGKIVQLYAAGESPNASMVAQYRAISNDFGLTPVAQGKVRPSGEKPKDNPFTKNGKRSA